VTQTEPSLARPGASRGQLGWLAVLYAVQGLPFGFQASALGVYLRERGVSLEAIGFAGALSAPWLLKALWAPLVDHHKGGPLGARRSWIVPMQVGLAATMAGAGLLPDGDVHPLLVLVFLMNLFAATMDIAVDGLAVDLLRVHQLGLGNSIQVVGYKVGMLFGGGILVWATARLGWSLLFFVMAALTLAAMGLALAMREPPPLEPVRPPEREASYREPAGPSRDRLLDVVKRQWATLALPGAIPLVLLVTTYKIGEALIDPMFGPMLVDGGVARETIGLWVGTYGMATSIAGSVVGGLLGSRISLVRALLFAGGMRGLPMLMTVLIAFGALPVAAAPIAIAAEHFFAGMMTTSMFAFMMARVDRKIGASHYTLLATIEVLGKTPPSLLSGVLAGALGFGSAFSVGLGAAALWPILALLLARRTPAAT
jgi:predicted MFS family arabinose efflux permease